MTRGAPGKFKIYATNRRSEWDSGTGSRWTLLHDQQVNLIFVTCELTEFQLDSNISTLFQYYAMVVTTLAGDYGWLMLAEWDVLGKEPYKCVLSSDQACYRQDPVSSSEYPTTSAAITTAAGPEVVSTWINGGNVVRLKSSHGVLGSNLHMFQLFSNNLRHVSECFHGTQVYSTGTPFPYNGATSIRMVRSNKVVQKRLARVHSRNGPKKRRRNNAREKGTLR